MSKEAMKLALEALEFIPESGSMLGTQAETKRLQAITALREALANEALDKMAENARELGLDYEPAQQEPAWRTDGGIPRFKPASVEWGVDWGQAGQIPCVSIIKRLPGGGIEVVAVEYAPYEYNPPAQQEPVAWMELLREARDNCKASIVEEGISASRKEYRIDLEARLTAALNTSPPAQRKPLTNEQFQDICNRLSRQGGWDGDGWDLALKEAIEAAHGIKERNQ